MPVYRLVLSLLLSALQPYGGECAGEYCHSWPDAFNIWHRGFQCPEHYDGQDARYCCGTCTLRYCCTAAEARLDQSTCDNDNFIDFENDGKTTKPPYVPTYLPFLIIVSAFVSFVVIGSVVAICCCHFLKPQSGGSQNSSAHFQNCLLEPGSLSSDGMTPSHNSSASLTSTAVGCQQKISTLATEVTVGMFGPTGSGHPVSGPQSQQYMPPTQPPGPYFQPYLNYGIPPEHALLMPQTYLENCATYGQQAYLLQQNPIHTEQLYTAATV